MARKIFTEQEGEAALCLWEAMIEAKCAAEEREGYGGGVGSDLLAAWEDAGVMFMRQEALRLAHVICETMPLISVEVRERHPFDWEVVPAILKTFRWTHAGGTHDEPAQIAAVVSQSLNDQHLTLMAKGRAAA